MLAHTGIKRVSLRGVTEIPSIDGIRDGSIAEGGVKFLYSGEISALLACLADMKPTDVSITDPELDEILINYYGRSEEK